MYPKRWVSKEDLEKLDVRLCSRCLERYTVPCAAVCIEIDADSVGHVVLFQYNRVFRHNRAPHGCVFYKALRRCGERRWVGVLAPARSPFSEAGFWESGLYPPLGVKKGDWRGVILMGYRTLFCGEFVNYLLQRYPCLQGRLLTRRTLREAGCDLETEIVMWQLANGCPT
jgi:hypothetical protein